MKILVINCGSSSIKFRLLERASGSPEAEADTLASGLLDRIGETGGSLDLKWRAVDGEHIQRTDAETADHEAGMTRIFQALRSTGHLDEGLDAIGHRVVHGGTYFSAPARIDVDCLDKIRRVVPLAPLHNPINLAGIEACVRLFPELPQVAVFDTAFHQTMPEPVWRYALPDEWVERYGVRRYGFHGTSHAYVARRAATLLGKPLEKCNLISLHLGNGASACAIRDGRSMDTSMGLTPLEGLIMGTRCGDMDPAIPDYMEHSAGLRPEQVEEALNRQSGLKAICGDYDMRVILRRAGEGNRRARLAIDMYCHRLRKYVGAYSAVLGRVDAVVFTGGIGEHAAPIRAQACAGLENLGLRLDAAANAAVRGESRIGALDTLVEILVIPTDEELEIANQTTVCLSG